MVGTVRKLFVEVWISQGMEIVATIVTVGILVGVGYLYLRSYWIDDPWFNSELFR